MARRAAKAALMAGALMASSAEGAASWLSGAGEALQGLVTSVSGQTIEQQAFLAQCTGVPALLSELGSNEYKGCYHDQFENMQMMFWFVKKSVSNGAPGGKIEGVTMETTPEEDQKYQAMLHRTMKESCGNQMCMNLHRKAINVTMGCYLSGACHMMKNMPDDDEDDGDDDEMGGNPFKDMPESKCLDILTRGVMHDIEANMQLSCMQEAGPDGKTCAEVLEVDFMAQNPQCYAQLNGPIPQCMPECKQLWTSLSKKSPVCTKAIDQTLMNSKQNQLKLLKEIMGSEALPMEMPMITISEVCSRSAAAGSSSSMNIQI